MSYTVELKEKVFRKPTIQDMDWAEKYGVFIESNIGTLVYMQKQVRLDTREIIWQPVSRDNMDM